MRPWMVLVFAVLAAGCLGDPPPAAEDLPLEVVVHPHECLLNYPQVGPGTHDVTVIYEGTSGSVSIVKGEEVIFADADADTVDLEAGEYMVVCQVGGQLLWSPIEVRDGLSPGGG